MMAAAVDADEDFFQCSICIEDYTRPRKLPKCGHTFCEDCLVAYAKKLKDTKKNSQGFPCPLCRGINAAAMDLIDPGKWVEKLEINVDAVRRLTTKVTNGTQFCNPCLELQRFSNTGWFCFECRDMLCVPATTCTECAKLLDTIALYGLTEISTKENHLRRFHNI